VRYEVSDTIGQKVDAEIVITYLPESTDDVSTGHKPGTPVTVDILGNDRGDFDPSTARFIDPASGARVTRLTVPGEGVWTVDPATGAATFTPQSGFMGDPTPVQYEVSDLRGNPTVSLITIRYIPSLASTGADVAAPLAAALLALLLGAAAMVIARRRRA
jgi:LPXTG-motif cell wall-anchored protein